jgi:hypothetical protein
MDKDGDSDAFGTNFANVIPADFQLPLVHLGPSRSSSSGHISTMPRPTRRLRRALSYAPERIGRSGGEEAAPA